MTDFDYAFQHNINIAEQAVVLRKIEDAITLAANPPARKTVREMLQTYRFVIELRSRNEFMSILLDAREQKQSSTEEEV